MAVGPVDVYIIGFPGNKFTGRIAPAIMELVENGTIRVLDLLFVMKDADGVVTTIAAADIDEEGAAFLAIDVTQPGALGPEDAEEVGDDLPANSAALLIAFENLWAAKVVDALLAADAVLIDSIRIPADVVERRPRGKLDPVHVEIERNDMGLLRMAARTAVVAGTATAVSGRVARRQAARYDEQDAQQYQEPQHAATRRRRRRTTRPPSSRSWRSCTRRACSPTRSSRPPRPRFSESDRIRRGPVRHVEAYSRLAGVYDEIVIDPCHDRWASFLHELWSADPVGRALRARSLLRHRPPRGRADRAGLPGRRRRRIRGDAGPRSRAPRP